MSEVFKVMLSLSLSGSVLILAILLIGRVLKRHLSKHWQYYIWIVVALRLIIPFSLDYHKDSIFGGEQSPAPASHADNMLSSQNSDGSLPDVAIPSDIAEESARISFFGDVIERLPNLPDFLWILWILIALVMLIRKITLYQSFAKYIKAGKTEVSDPAILNLFGTICEKLGINRHIELYTNSLVSSPLIIGLFRPCVVLPSMPAGEMEFRYICLHELIHYKKGDFFYKWLMQITLCLHWFNPLVHLMIKETARICELSCDHVLIQSLNADERELYGDTLLESLKNPGEYYDGIAALSLSENASRLGERLNEIREFSKRRKGAIALSVILAACLFFGGFSLGVYTFNRTEATYYHLVFLNVQPSENDFYDEIFFEISREGKPEDLIESYLKTLLLSLYTPPRSWNYRNTKIHSKDELIKLYNEAKNSDKIIEYVVIDESEVPSAEAVSMP